MSQLILSAIRCAVKADASIPGEVQSFNRPAHQTRNATKEELSRPPIENGLSAIQQIYYTLGERLESVVIHNKGRNPVTASAGMDMYFPEGFTLKSLIQLQEDLLSMSPRALEGLIQSSNVPSDWPEYNLKRILTPNEFSPRYGDNGDYIVIEFNVEVVTESNSVLTKGVMVQYHKASETFAWANYLESINRH